jgi:hypothetical protein
MGWPIGAHAQSDRTRLIGDQDGMSASPRKADVRASGRHIRYGPTAALPPLETRLGRYSAINLPLLIRSNRNLPRWH